MSAGKVLAKCPAYPIILRRPDGCPQQEPAWNGSSPHVQRAPHNHVTQRSERRERLMHSSVAKG